MITIGAKPDASFAEPLRLLSDCHRRIERFLDRMILVSQTARGGTLTGDDREAFSVALRYFQQAAPLHSRDEEESLFPRLRGTGDDAAASALAVIDALEADHRRADEMHAEVDRIGRKWLESGPLESAEADRLSALLTELRNLYRRHIAVEDNEIFPLAGRLLGSAAISNLGREMARRRGLDPDNLPGVSHCQLRKTRTSEG